MLQKSRLCECSLRRRQILALSSCLFLIKIPLRLFYPPNQESCPAFHPPLLSKIPLRYLNLKKHRIGWELCTQAPICVKRRQISALSFGPLRNKIQ